MEGAGTAKVYVGNLPETCRRQELKEMFEKYGKIVECDIIRDYAFVVSMDFIFLC